MNKSQHYLIALLFLACSPVAQAQIITTIVNTDTIRGYNGDGIDATSAHLCSPDNIFVDGPGNLYISEYCNSRIRKVDAGGIIHTIVGTGTNGYSGNGGPATAAQVFNVFGMASDAAGNFYITDNCNCIRKINSAGIISLFAGDTGMTGFGFGGDGGPATAALFKYTGNMACDAAGNLYVADAGNGRIRKINTAGMITTYAGSDTIGYGGDGGPATNAKLMSPGGGMKFDNAGNLYFIDGERVRKIDAAGIITTIAGGGTGGGITYGDGGPATNASFNTPGDMAIDATGDVFIADTYHFRIRKVNTTGIINTIAGTGMHGYSGDGGDPIYAKISGTFAITFDNKGNLILVDADASCVRAIKFTQGIDSVNKNEIGLHVFPDPTEGNFTLQLTTATNEQAKVTIENMIGQKVAELTFMTNQNTPMSMQVAPGMYIVTAVTTGGTQSSRIIIR